MKIEIFSDTLANFWEIIGGVGGVLGALALVLALPKVQKFLQKSKISDVVAVDFDFFGVYYDGVLLDFDPHKSLKNYVDKGLLAYHKPMMSISIRSKSNEGWVRVAPYVWIEISKSFLPHHSKSYVNMEDGKGGGGMPRYMNAVFLKESPKKFKAAFLGEDFYSHHFFEREELLPDRRKLYESFTLEPGEIEIFDIDFIIEPGEVYEFRVGVDYIFDEKSNIIWSDTYKICVPQDTELWTVRGISRPSPSWEGGTYPENYMTIGLVKLIKQDYVAPTLNIQKAKQLFDFCQKFEFRMKK